MILYLNAGLRILGRNFQFHLFGALGYEKTFGHKKAAKSRMSKNVLTKELLDIFSRSNLHENGTSWLNLNFNKILKAVSSCSCQ